ncbi:Stk1 family PASTA domain-containing Ser/Thr kinase [Oscillospiraceae bacterium CM]|nr:Stk1 family PASTA domain-containing Ser/Thr kinase [Oscillospiraceae bacterium CM]
MESTDRYIGQILDNRYEILEKIGTGGMAVVYKARCHRLNRLVAVKILKEELSDDADFRRRFHTESQAVAMLSHPNIVAVYDVSRSGNIEYIVMELIEGITLKQYISRKGQLNWKEALHFATQVTKALGHAHSRGIIHRDIKPHNIMILKDGSVKVADFGIARLQSNQNTLTQEALGSVHYISPEQAKGSHVDARSDLYSVGVVLYEMLTSHLPFEGDSAVSVAIQHISAIPLMPRELNPDIPVGLESITMHAMEPDLNRRYATAEELLADLEEFRKNPALEFSFVDKNAAGQPTRKVPSSAIVKAESILPKPVRPVVRTPELSRAEYSRSAKRAMKTSSLVSIILISVFLVAAVVFLATYFISNWNQKATTVTVPKFVTLTYDDVVGNPENTQIYHFSKTDVYDASIPAGVIISQDPQPNRQYNKQPGSLIDVNLTVSRGPEPEQTMPDLSNMDIYQAQSALSSLMLDLDVKTTAQSDDSITKDYVIKTTPAAGDALTKGMTVFIIYSSGPEPVTVPDVTGLPISQAESRLKSYGLTWKIQYQASDTAKDTVIFQSIPKDAQVPKNSQVILTVSTGPSTVTSPPPSPSISPSTSPSP